jgi:hypothetical protein
VPGRAGEGGSAKLADGTIARLIRPSGTFSSRRRKAPCQKAARPGEAIP